MFDIKRKHVVTASLLVLLVVAGYLNWSYNQDKASQTAQGKILGEAAYVNSDVNVPENDYFAMGRIEREKAREQSKEILNELINNPNTDQEAKTKAQDSIIALAKAVDDESACETLLRNKGFTDVMVSINEENATVSVKTEGLIPSQIAQIHEVVTSETGLGADKIKIFQAS